MGGNARRGFTLLERALVRCGQRKYAGPASSRVFPWQAHRAGPEAPQCSPRTCKRVDAKRWEGSSPPSDKPTLNTSRKTTAGVWGVAAGFTCLGFCFLKKFLPQL